MADPQEEGPRVSGLPPSSSHIRRRKTERNLEIVHQVMDLERSTAEVAREFGISRRRVQQIIHSPRSWISGA